MNPVFPGKNNSMYSQSPPQSITASRPRFISIELFIILVMAALDTVSTIWLVGSGIASEANPIMRFYLERGMAAFVMVRMLMVSPAFVLESMRYRTHKPIKLYLRAAIVVYFSAYMLGTLAQYAKFFQ